MRPARLRLKPLLLLFGLATAAGWFSSCGSLDRTVGAPPQIEGAAFIGNTACVECHTNYARTFAISPHARIRLEGAPGQMQTSCESCHGAGSKHALAGGGRGVQIINPGKHPESCLQCHLSTHTAFNLPHHHPVLEGRMNCVQCHDPHGLDIMKPARGLAMARVNESCAACHREQSRPVAFEHEAMREGCISCHEPHGSINRKMLRQQDVNLCLRCHTQNPGILAGTGRIFIGSTDHSSFVSRATCWAAGCHTAVHGSNVDVQLKY